MKMTYGIAHSLGMDAANKQMRQNDRTIWNEADYNLAAATLNKYFPLCMELPDIEPELCGCSRCMPVTQMQQHSLFPTR